MSLTQINKAGLDEIALDHVFTIGASGSSAYTFQGEGLNGTVNNPTLYLTRGKTYRFENGSGGHPIRIQSTSGASGTAYNTGVTNNAGSGTVIVEVQHDAPDVLYYQCTSHAAMNGILYITGALADGGVTTAKIADGAVTAAKIASQTITADKIASNAVNTPELVASAVSTSKLANNSVTTDKIADNAITNAKIASGAVGTNKLATGAVGSGEIATGSIVNSNISSSAAIAGSKLADSSVGTAKIADQAVTLDKLPHGTSSNDGKFLRANNGADPTFETVSGTTINSNADNRVITGSNTANTLTGETNVHVTSGKFLIGTSTVNNGLPYTSSGAIQTLGAYNTASINIVNNENNGNTCALTFNKVRGVSGSAGGSDAMGGINWGAWDGTAWRSGITVEGKLTSIGANAVPSKLIFKVNSGSSNTERFAITPNGVTFNGDTAATNALDDYERGNWTPTLNRASGSTSGTLHTAMGMYIKIGKLVYITFHVYRTGAGGGSSYYELGGLPFGVDSSNQGSWSISPHMTRSYFDSEKAAGDNAIGIKFLGSGNTYGYAYNADTDNWYTTNTSTIVLKGQMTYITAS